MRVLVDYLCRSCAVLRTELVAQPPPGDRSCPCGGTAQRRFGIRLLTGAGESNPPAAAALSEGSCAGHAAIPGACVLTDTAVRSLSARMRGDERALEREQAHQRSAIAAGALDPTVPPLRQHATAPRSSTSRS